MSVRTVWSDAALGHGKAGDIGHLLCRLLREQPEQLLDRDLAGNGDPAEGGCLALDREVLAQESDRFPVRVGELDADLRREGGGQLVVAFGRVGEETLVVDVDLAAVHRVRRAPVVLWGARDQLGGVVRGPDH